MVIMRFYLFFGLVLHKVIWEALRHKSVSKPSESGSTILTLIKIVKVGVLIGVLVQIWLPDILPIAIESFNIRSTGTVIYTVGLATAIIGRFQLGDNWANIESGQVLQDQNVVASGMYSYIRHPIYVGDLLLLTGLELALNSWMVLGVLILTPVVLFKAMKEERMLAEKLTGYDIYCQRSKRFIPFVF